MTKEKASPKPQPQNVAHPSIDKAETQPILGPEASFPIVGIGASAGGLAAFEAFFSGMNLVKNAVEASPKEGRVTVTCQTEPGALCIIIHNAGAVPEAVRDRFFEKYATAGKVCGTGLGTYSAQLIAKAHGGRIELATSEAEGTRVTVVLPCPAA